MGTRVLYRRGVCCVVVLHTARERPLRQHAYMIPIWNYDRYHAWESSVTGILRVPVYCMLYYTVPSCMVWRRAVHKGHVLCCIVMCGCTAVPVLCCTVRTAVILYYTVLYGIILYCTVWFCTVLSGTELCCTNAQYCTRTVLMLNNCAELYDKSTVVPDACML